MGNSSKYNFIVMAFLKIKQLFSDKIACYYIKKSGLFDEALYLKNYPDVARVNKWPVAHYIQFGWKEERSPNPLFDAQWYLKTNSDIAASKINPLYHYVRYGWKEGRSPNPLFNAPWYLAANSDVAHSGCEPLWHYQTYGWKRGCSPDPLFDVEWYLKTNSDVATSDWEPLHHYQKKGYQEGRFPNILFNAACLANILTKKYGQEIEREVTDWLSLLKKIENKNIDDLQYHEIIKKLEENIKKIPQVKTTNHHHCDISIIIPVYNQLAYTLICVTSLLRLKTDYSYEILIGDDASTDNTHEVFSNLHSSIKVIHHKENLGFIRNCNATAQYARGDYLLFLNNDTIVLPGALDALVSIFKTRKDAGLVGAKLLNSDGTLQEAGGIIWNDGSGWNYGRGDDESLSAYNYVREVDYCSGACLLTTLNIWRQLNGFNELYSPAYYEDTDFSFRVREIKKKVYYQPLAELIHYEGISNGRNLSLGLKKHQSINQKKFFERWKGVLEKDHHSLETELIIAKARAKEKKTILFIDHEIPTPDQDAGSKSILSYIKFFIKKDFKVILLANNHKENQPYSDLFRNMGVEILIGNKFSQNWKQWFIQYGKYIHYVFLSRPHTSLRWIGPLRTYTSAKLLFYGHDLVSRTRKRAYDEIGVEEHKKTALEFKEHEDAIHSLVDAIFYPSQVEVDYLSAQMNSNHIRQIPLYIYENGKKNTNYFPSQRNGLLFVGGFRHPPNKDAISWFIEHAFSQVQKALSNIQLTIVGANMPSEFLKLNSKSIIIKSNISDEELDQIKNNVRLTIAPLRFGGGIKGKIVESLASGLPVITTPIGAEGLKSRDNFLIISSLHDFAKEIIRIYDNYELLSELSVRGLEYVEKNFSEKVFQEVISEWIPEIR